MSIKALEKKINAVAKDKKLLGAIVSCTARDVHITYDKLEALCKTASLASNLYPIRPSCRKAFTKAIKETKREATGYLFRKIDEDPTEKVVGVVNERKLKETRDLDYSVDCKLILDKINMYVKVEGADSAGHGKRCQMLFQSMFSDVLSRDLKEWFRKTLRYELNAVKLSDEGSSYFAAAPVVESVLRMQQVVDVIGGKQQGTGDPKTYANVFLIPDQYDNKETAGINVRAGLMSELESLQQEIKEWQATPPRIDTMERRINEYDSMRTRAKMYVRMLDINAESLLQGIDDCKKIVGKLLKVQIKEIGETELAKRAKRKAWRDTQQAKKIKKPQQPKQPKAMASKVKLPVVAELDIFGSEEPSKPEFLSKKKAKKNSKRKSKK
jgi:hypothetical protein